MNGCENSDQSGSQMKKHNFTKIWGPCGPETWPLKDFSLSREESPNYRASDFTKLETFKKAVRFLSSL